MKAVVVVAKRQKCQRLSSLRNLPRHPALKSTGIALKPQGVGV